MTEQEFDDRLTELEARLRAVESNAADPWPESPPTLAPPDLRPALEGPVLLPDVTEGFWAILGAATLVNGTYPGPYQYSYAFTEAGKTATAYSGWTTLSGGRTGTAYNGYEYANTSPGANPQNSVVRMYEVPVTGGTVEYWFEGGPHS